MIKKIVGFLRPKHEITKNEFLWQQIMAAFAPLNGLSRDAFSCAGQRMTNIHGDDLFYPARAVDEVVANINQILARLKDGDECGMGAQFRKVTEQLDDAEHELSMIKMILDSHGIKIGKSDCPPQPGIVRSVSEGVALLAMHNYDNARQENAQA